MTNSDDIDNKMAKTIDGVKDIVSQLRQHQKEYKALDLAQLEKDGIIIKKGAWYHVPDISKVPDAFSYMINEVKQDSKGKGTFVKIRKIKDPFSKSIKRFEKLGF